MPATVIYKSGFPSALVPVQTSASASANGLVSASASFVINAQGVGDYQVNSPISPGLFPSLQNTSLQSLFVESRSVEKRNGLWMLDIKAVGVLNPPVFEIQKSTSSRSFSKTVSFLNSTGEQVTQTLSFDYEAENISVTTAYASSAAFPALEIKPQLLSVWNRVGRGLVEGRDFTIGQQGIDGALIATQRIITSRSTQERANIVQLSQTYQLVFE